MFWRKLKRLIIFGIIVGIPVTKPVVFGLACEIFICVCVGAIFSCLFFVSKLIQITDLSEHFTNGFDNINNGFDNINNGLEQPSRQGWV